MGDVTTRSVYGSPNLTETSSSALHISCWCVCPDIVTGERREVIRALLLPPSLAHVDTLHVCNDLIGPYINRESTSRLLLGEC